MQLTRSQSNVKVETEKLSDKLNCLWLEYVLWATFIKIIVTADWVFIWKWWVIRDIEKQYRNSIFKKWHFFSNQLGIPCFSTQNFTKLWYAQQKMNTFLKLYGQAFIGNIKFINHIVLGNLVFEEFQKSKLRIFYCNQLFKYVEQLPVKVLFFILRAFIWNIFNLLFMASPSLPSPKSGYSLVVIKNTEL